VRFNEVDVLFLQTVHRGPGGVHWRSILLQCPPVMTTIVLMSGSRPFSRTILHAAVWAVNSRIDEDHPCLPHTRYSDRQHDDATKV